MSAIENNGQARSAKNHASENSRRPGTAGHPGKHLGQFKKMGIEPDQASKPLIAQQLNSLQGGGANAKAGQQQEDSILNITANHMNDMSDAFADQIDFTGKMHAISTAFF